MKVLLNNLLDDYSTITTSDEDAYNPVTNIAIKRLADFFKTTEAGAKEILITLNTAVEITEIALAYHNLVSGDTLSIEAYPDADGFGGVAVSQALTIRDGIIYQMVASAFFPTTRYYKLVIDKNVGDNFYLGFLFIGNNDFEEKHIAGTMPSIEDNGSVSESRGFQVYTSDGQSRIGAWVFGHVTEVDLYKQFVALYQTYKKICGIFLPCHEALDYKEPVFGFMTKYEPGGQNYGWYRWSYTIVEGK